MASSNALFASIGTAFRESFIWLSSLSGRGTNFSSPSYRIVNLKSVLLSTVPTSTSPFSFLAPIYSAESSAIFLSSSALTLSGADRPIIITKQSKIDMKPLIPLFFITKYSFPKFPISNYIGIS